MGAYPLQRLSYPIGFILFFSTCYFILQIILGVLIRQMGVAPDFVLEMIRNHELSVQVISLLGVLYLIENNGKVALSWPRAPWHSFETFVFSPNPRIHPSHIHPESPWSVLWSGLCGGLVVAGVLFGILRFAGIVWVEDGDLGFDTIWLILPYFFTQFFLFVFWVLLVGKLRGKVADFFGKQESLPVADRVRFPFAVRLVYICFESQLLFRIIDPNGAWPDRLLVALFCLLLSATPLFLEEDLRDPSPWAEHYIWKRKILRLGSIAGFWAGIFYVFGWRSGIPWKVSLYYSTEGPLLGEGAGVLVLGAFVLVSNTLLQLPELRRSPALRHFAADVSERRRQLALRWRAVRAAVSRKPARLPQ